MKEADFKAVLDGLVHKETKPKNNLFFDLGCSLVAIATGIVIILAGLAWIISGILF